MATSTRPAVRRDDDDGANSMLPIYKRLSQKNGQINRMTKEELKLQLAEFQLDTRGGKDVLKKRLKNFVRKREMVRAKVQGPGNPATAVKYFAVIDFEATCQETNSPEYNHEIIEFPVLLVDTAQRKIVDEFHSYVRPVLNPILSSFCTTLTGITQDMVRQCDTFPSVLKRVETWMASHKLGEPGYSFAALTDGPWDMARFLHSQCLLSKVDFPQWARKWINVRKAFSNFYGVPRCKLTMMLQHMELTFEGNEHSGIDDARNIARIAVRMLQDGCDLQVNERIFRDKLRKLNLCHQDIEHVKKTPKFTMVDNEKENSDKDPQERDETSFDEEVTSTAHLLTSSLRLGVTKHCKSGKMCGATKRKPKTLDKQLIDEDEDFDDLLSYFALQKS